MTENPSSLTRTRPSLIDRLKRNDPQSWEAFCDTYGKLIYRVALRAGLTDDEAKEVRQNTFLSVSKSIQAFKYDPAIGSFKGWLLKTTSWRIHDQLRIRQREAARLKPRSSHNTGTRTATIDRVPAGPAPGDIGDLIKEEYQTFITRTALKWLKQQINPKHYQAFDLYVMKDWPPQKVADTLGISPGQVFLIKHRVLPLLEAEISRLETEGS